MNKRTLLFRNLVYYRQVNLAIIAGMAVAVAVIVGALSVGDSVRNSLINIVEYRLGMIESALISKENMFNASLAKKIAEASNAKTAPILLLPGTASDPQGRLRINNVNVIGINKEFEQFSLKNRPQSHTLTSSTKSEVHKNRGQSRTLTSGTKSEVLIPTPIFMGAIINKEVAVSLNLKLGDEFILRMAKPAILPGDLPLLSENDNILSFRLYVKTIASDTFPGNFSFRSNQIAPANIFIPLEWLGKKTGTPGKANVIIARGEKSNLLQEKLNKVWSLNDVGLKPIITKNGTIELKSKKIFISDTISAKAMKIPGAQGVLTYFVNSIKLKTANRKTKKQTPYSFVTGIEGEEWAKFYPFGKNLLQNDEIILNQWLADDLSAKIGDTIELKYFIPGPMRKLVEEKHSFKVTAIIPIAGEAANPSLMPDFPGLSNTEKCSDWDTSIPIKMKLIREKDEAYWKKYKGTPKAFISLSTAQKIWANRFGNLTMIRFISQPESTKQESVSYVDFDHENRTTDPVLKQNQDHSHTLTSRTKPEVLSPNPILELRNSLKATDFDLAFIPIKKDAEKSASNGVDFGGLFIGLSFFLLFSAFMLTALLFLLGVESRCKEFSILKSLGFSIREIRRLFMLEGIILACIGAILGVPLGLLYNQTVLYLLGSIWKGTVGTTSILANVNPQTPVIGALASVLIAWITMHIALGKYTKNLHKPDERKIGSMTISPKIKLYLIISIILFICAIILIVTTLLSAKPGSNTAIFFICGGILLISNWLCWRFSLEWFKKYNLLIKSPTPFNLALKNTTFNTMRSMAAVILLSCGIFLTLAVAINKRTTPNPRDKTSGTGGYSFFIKTSIPVTHDMNTNKGKSALGLDRNLFKDVSFVNMSLSEGDNASCLNLNKITRPAILGVNFAKFANPKRFTFVGTRKDIAAEEMWNALDSKKKKNKQKRISYLLDRSEQTAKQEKEKAIPAVADQEVIIWSMGKSLGSDLLITDEEGNKKSLQLDGALASSVFQGYVLIPKTHFHALFPSVSGARCILVDAPADKRAEIKSAIADSLIDHGAEITTCNSRLDEFYRVANTYLSIFLILGSMGLLIGIAGFGAIVLRNITERKFELAIMNATGFSKALIRKIIVMEHIILISAGSLSGGITAFVAVIPALYFSTTEPPYILVISLFLLIILCGIISVYLATWFATKESTIKTLRKE